MLQKNWLSLLLLFLIPGVMFAQSGKIRGSALDSKTKEPLIGANIIIEGTNFGASTDVEGTFIILNVPIGTYTVKASYVGYRNFTITNVRVSGELTTEVKFELTSEDVQVQTVEIVAERPLINKDYTNTLKVKTAEDMETLPVRGVANIIGLQASIVKDEASNTFYVRGGRAEETATFIDGVPVTSAFSGQSSAAFANLGQSSIEELQVQTGGFNAEYGSAMSGVINATTKSGSPHYSVSGEVITDGFISPKVGENGGWGFNIYNGSISGPIIPDGDNATFFLGAERQYLGDNDPRAIGGYKPNASTQSWNYNAKVMVRPMKTIEVRVGGTAYLRTGNTWNFNLTNDDLYQNSAHNNKFDNTTYTGFARFTHNVNSNLFYTVQGSYFLENLQNGDPVFWNNLTAYGDTNQNSNLAAQGVRNNPLYSTLSDAGRVNNGIGAYGKSKQETYTVNGDINWQYGDNLFKAGVEYRAYNVRRYRVAPLTIASNQGTPWQKYEAAYAGYYGYSFDAKSEDNTNDYFGSHREGPKTPMYFAGYIQDKIELSDLVLNLGLRLDYFDANEQVFKDPLNPFGARGTANGGIFDASDMKNSTATTTISPRLGFSFPITDRAVFHAQYGVFLQQPPLQDVLLSKTFAEYMIGSAPSATVIPNPDLKPEKTISYEVGFRQLITDNAALGFTAFYKEIKDLIQYRNVGTNTVPAYPNSYETYQNVDFGTVKGLDMIFELKRTHNLAFTLNYTLSYADGTGSNPATQFRITWLQTENPKVISPLDYDRRHSGSANLDFRTLKNEGPEIAGIYPFENFGINLLCTFNSGIAYTPSTIINTSTWATTTAVQPTAGVNSATGPWNYRVDFKIDRAFKISTVNAILALYVINITNAKNVYTVWAGTGDANNDGFLTSPQGQVYASQYGAQGVAAYQFHENDPNNYGVPRQVRLGLRLEY
jgi:outer membrane receptor for ferrienterochelin and colicin